FLSIVKNTCINAFNHQTYPFDELVKDLNVVRDPSRNAMFDVMFTYESGGIPDFKLNDIDTYTIVPENKTSKFDFSLEVTPTKDSFSFRVEYSTGLYRKSFMENLLDCYINIINKVAENIDIQISKSNILSEIPYRYPQLDYPKDLRI